MASDSWIEFVRWPYAAEDWHVELRAADGGYRVEQEFYTDPSTLLDLADRLRAFPTHHQDEVLLEMGHKSPDWAHWVILRVFVVDTAGHAAVTIDVGNNGDWRRERAARFSIGCDVASLNRLGDELRDWIQKPDSTLHCQLFSS